MLHTLASCQKSGCLYLRTQPKVKQSLEVSSTLIGDLAIVILFINKYWPANCFTREGSRCQTHRHGSMLQVNIPAIS